MSVINVSLLKSTLRYWCRYSLTDFNWTIYLSTNLNNKFLNFQKLKPTHHFNFCHADFSFYSLCFFFSHLFPDAHSYYTYAEVLLWGILNLLCRLLLHEFSRFSVSRIASFGLYSSVVYLLLPTTAHQLFWFQDKFIKSYCPYTCTRSRVCIYFTFDWQVILLCTNHIYIYVCATQC